MCRPVSLSWTADATSAGTPSMFPAPLLASVKAEEKFMFLVYELFLGLSRGEETFDFGKCDGLRHDHPWIELSRRSFVPPSFSQSAPLPLVARTMEMGLLNRNLPLFSPGFLARREQCHFAPKPWI